MINTDDQLKSTTDKNSKPMTNKEVADTLRVISDLSSIGTWFYLTPNEKEALTRAVNLFSLLAVQDDMNSIWDNTKKDK